MKTNIVTLVIPKKVINYSKLFTTDKPQPYNKIGDGPEGPEVRRVAEYLGKRLPGMELVDIQWDNKSRYRKGARDNEKFNNMYERFKEYLPLIINKVSSRGKCIIFELYSYKSNSVIYMANHLIMTGKWVYEPTEHSNIWLVLGKDIDTVPIVQVLSKIYFDDARHQGFFEFYYDKEELELEKFGKKLGEDLLDAALNNIDLLPLWKKKIAIESNNKRRRVVMEIRNFLKDQKYFSGIGNYLRAEILYEAKVSPFRDIKTLTEQEIEMLYMKSMEIMKNSYLCHGLTISDYEDPEGFKGTYPVKVYQQKTDPYGNSVEAFDKSTKNQTMHWVPSVQR